MSTSTAPGRARWLLLAATAVLLLGGCGGNDGSDGDGTAQDPASDTSAPTSEAPTSGPTDDGPTGAERDWPVCGTVWRDGATLPGGYAGCLDGGRDGDPIKADRYPCSSGQRLITYDDSFYATAGGTVTRTEGPVRQDGGFRQVLATCQG